MVFESPEFMVSFEQNRHAGQAAGKAWQVLVHMYAPISPVAGRGRVRLRVDAIEAA